MTLSKTVAAIIAILSVIRGTMMVHTSKTHKPYLGFNCIISTNVSSLKNFIMKWKIKKITEVKKMETNNFWVLNGHLVHH